MTLGSDAFVAKLHSLLQIEDRQISIQNRWKIGDPYEICINFINLPAGIASLGGGAEAENNRLSFWIYGFGKESSDSPPPSGKVKLEAHVCTLGRQWRLRGKTGSPENVVKYLAEFLNKVVREVPPNWTHTPVENRPEKYN